MTKLRGQAGLALRTRAFARCLAAALLGVVWVGCRQGQVAVGESSPRARVELRDLVETCAEDGFLEPAKVAAIPAEFEARVLEVCVREGDRVRAGDVLVRLNPAELAARLRAAEAEARAAQVKREALRFRREGLDRLEADQQWARAELEFAEADRAARLQEELALAGLASDRERDAARSRRDAARAGLEAAALRVDEVESGIFASPEIAELDARLARLDLELDQLRKRAGACAVTAPFDGVVLFLDRGLKRLHIPEGGARFQPEQGGVMAIVADVDAMTVAAEFFERDVARLKPGLPVLVTARHAPGRTFEGVIAAIGRQGKRHGQTAVVPVEVSVPNPDHALMAGLTAEIRVVTGERRAVPSLPVAFVGHDAEGRAVWRVKPGGRIERAAVTTGLTDGRFVEIVSGLREGDEVAMESP
jgi:multidrug efflux pump subunit AcrA (membrane-fusion protein)